MRITWVEYQQQKETYCIRGEGTPNTFCCVPCMQQQAGESMPGISSSCCCTALCTLTPNVQQQGLKIKVRKARRGTIVGGETPSQKPFDISLQAQCGLSFSATTMDTGHPPLSSTIEIKMVSSWCGGDTRYCPTLWRLGWLLDLFRVFLQGFLFSLSFHIKIGIVAVNWVQVKLWGNTRLLTC